MSNSSVLTVVKSAAASIAVAAAIAGPPTLIASGQFDLVYGASGGDVGFLGGIVTSGAGSAGAALAIDAAASFGVSALAAGPAGWIAATLVVGL